MNSNKVGVCPQSFKLDYVGKSDSPTPLYPPHLIGEGEGFPFIGSHSYSWEGPTAAGSSWLGFLHFLINSILLHVLLSWQIFIWLMKQNRLQVVWIHNTTMHFFEDKIISFHWRLYKHFTLHGPCIAAKMTALNGEQRDMISLDKMQEAGVPGNRKRFLLYAFKHFS